MISGLGSSLSEDPEAEAQVQIYQADGDRGGGCIILNARFAVWPCIHRCRIEQRNQYRSSYKKNQP